MENHYTVDATSTVYIILYSKYLDFIINMSMWKFLKHKVELFQNIRLIISVMILIINNAGACKTFP